MLMVSHLLLYKRPNTATQVISVCFSVESGPSFHGLGKQKENLEIKLIKIFVMGLERLVALLFMGLKPWLVNG